MDDAKLNRLNWLARVYSADDTALSDAVADQQLFDRSNDFGLDNFVTSYRPLAKLREQRGDLQFQIGAVTHTAPDLCLADLIVEGETLFKLYVRFEEAEPHRVLYWMSYPPLPEGIEVRTYQPDDAAGCVELERACPMEMADGSRWSVDRGALFDDYLQLMAPIDAAVAVHGDQIVGFFSCALRRVRFKGKDAYCVYQHHYRVHPDYRAGSISQALASAVDPRRTFQRYEVQFPYSMIDPNNLHMRNVGFPEVEAVRIARLAIPVGRAADMPLDTISSLVQQPDPAQICARINHTHQGRELFRPYDPALLADRWSRAGSYNHGNYLALNSAVLGVWRANELNIMDHDGTHDEWRLAFVMDYGFESEQDFVNLIGFECAQLASQGTTHLCFMCDSRAGEYPALARLADDEQRFAVHTLPWIAPDLAASTIYCDSFYC